MANPQYVYVMKALTKAYPGGRKVVEDVWLSFMPGAKIGVLGLNGSGKSTLLRIMAGIDTEFQGEAWAADGVQVGFLQQEPDLNPDKDVLGNVMEGVAGTKALLDRFNEVSMRFGEDLTADEMDDAACTEQAELQEPDRCGRCLGSRPSESISRWTPCAARPATLMSRSSPVVSAAASLSAGCFCRPSGHAPARRADQPSWTPNPWPGWTAASSQDFPGTVVAVTHDRYFLDNVAGWILELDRGQRNSRIEGNYTGWLAAKAESGWRRKSRQESLPACGRSEPRARMGPFEPACASIEKQGACVGL
jgi:ATPase subunit of ABC transporter with duplicated ATPase domains